MAITKKLIFDEIVAHMMPTVKQIERNSEKEGKTYKHVTGTRTFSCTLISFPLMVTS